jgi:hypothetical protein
MKVLALKQSVEYAQKKHAARGWAPVLNRQEEDKNGRPQPLFSRGTWGAGKIKGEAKDMKPQTPELITTPPVAQSSNNRTVDTATLELLKSWRLQDATDNPEEVRAAEEEITAFKRAMNENRIVAGEPLLYPWENSSFSILARLVWSLIRNAVLRW